MRILVTGAGGFVGGLLVDRLHDAGYALSLAGRTATLPAAKGRQRYFALGEVGSKTDWRPALEDCDVIVHLAAQVPLPGISDDAFSEVNDRGTAQLVEQAKASDARLFILISSVFAVTDNSTEELVSERTEPNPTTPYGRSKLAAESHLRLFEGPGRSAITLRPPLVYGKAASGNWRLLQRLAATGLPLPFGSVHNRRTLIAAENLADAIFHVVSRRETTGESGAYMISDEHSVSLRDILTWLRSGMDMPPRLVPVRPALLAFLLGILGKQKIAKSLLGDLEVDSSLFRSTFSWAPKVHPSDGIARSGAGFVR